MYYLTVFVLYVMFNQTVVTVTIRTLCIVHVYMITYYLYIVHVYTLVNTCDTT